MTLKIYTNESVSLAVAVGLKRRGIAAFSAQESGNLGLTDEAQLIFAAQQRAVIFTHDADFLRLAHVWATKKQIHWGVIYAHMEKTTVGECVRHLKDLAEVFNPEDFQNHVEFI